MNKLTPAQFDRVVELFNDVEEIAVEAQVNLVEMGHGPAVFGLSLHLEASKHLAELLNTAKEIQTLLNES